MSRRAKAKGSLSRRSRNTREEYAKVLIVCEGEKTEPHYFEDCREHYRLSNANIEVTGDSGSDPMSVVKHAKEEAKSANSLGDPYDAVYCVFDKDQHETYSSAVTSIKDLGDPFQKIDSVPCFEYWLLLHFGYTDKPYKPVPGKGCSAEVIADLRAQLDGYEKGNKDLFQSLLPNLDNAIENAEASLRNAKKAGTDNPSTRVHKLVTYLRDLKAESQDD